jgi:hypothetical protein
MKKTFFVVSILILMFFSIKNSSAQCAEFLLGNMAQSGFISGYGIQYYDPAGFNNYITLENQKYETKLDNFGTAAGFIVGAHLIQVQMEQIIVGIKLLYQQMNENKSTGGSINREYDLTLTSFGVGFATSLYITKRFDIKFLDAMITWNNAKLTNRYTDPYTSSEQKLQSLSSDVGFRAGGGLIFHIIPPYLSVEATGGYSFFTIREMQFDGGELLSQTPDGGPAMENFVESGGLFAFIQLNLSIPFK